MIPTPSGTGVFSCGVPFRPWSRPCKHGGNLCLVRGMPYTVSENPRKCHKAVPDDQSVELGGGGGLQAFEHQGQDNNKNRRSRQASRGVRGHFENKELIPVWI